MAAASVNHERLAHCVDRVFSLPADERGGWAQARVQRARKESTRLFEAGRVNIADRRLDAIRFVSGYRSKDRAYRLALPCAEAEKN
jgi:hypothetical protein